MKKYIVCEDKYRSRVDFINVVQTEAKVFDCLEDANDYARRKWDDYLTPFEKRRTHVFVCVVSEDDLTDYAVDDETGEVDWTSFTSSNYPVDGSGFDSMRGKAYIDTL